MGQKSQKIDDVFYEWPQMQTSNGRMTARLLMNSLFLDDSTPIQGTREYSVLPQSSILLIKQANEFE